MEELDLLKKTWNKSDNYPNVSEEKIYGMLHKNSSSAIKWIFIISVIEILFWTGLSFIFSDDTKYTDLLEAYHLKIIIETFTYVNYLIIVYFIIKFYRNYKKISTSDSVKGMLASILNSRNTVKYYFWYNLSMIIVIYFIFMISQITHDQKIQQILHDSVENSNMRFVFLIGVYLTILIFIIGVFILLYYIMYGLLLKRLKKNFNELKKIDFK
ncbi:hypothetical protein EQG63_10560 [Flavobacterium amnicola]|uniref:Uncharacterized protein n=1 Tax=Flavobacterium amnicola TaxID=2506422 RepID=A0A4Q1K0H8_9FLAO|nr:hypothetical protein [Flavobacterium amnicola]RXR17226.1 hypothetical protein EQG63_10560 [Flavobacterium amnicola]